MYTITKYCCGICGYEHRDEKAALFCESKSYPENTVSYNVGDEIKFARQVPSAGDGTILTWKDYRGVIRDKATVLNERTDKHHDLLIVETSDKKEDGTIDIYECVVAYYEMSGEGYKLLSTPQPIYQVGFGETQRKMREEAKAKQSA